MRSAYWGVEADQADWAETVQKSGVSDDRADWRRVAPCGDTALALGADLDTGTSTVTPPAPTLART